MPSVTRKAQSNRAQKRDEIQGRLLEAVERLLAEGDSYTELSVERLVQEAGISRSTFYVYFEDKGDLLRALVSDVIGELIAAARVWWDLPAGFTRDDMVNAIRGLIDTYRPHGRLLGAVVDTASYDVAVREQFDTLMQMSIKGVEAHIRNGQKAGFVREDLNPGVTASWLTWMAERGLYELVPGASDRRLAQLADGLTSILWHTLYDGTAKKR